jgi:parallel beta-helix repeat protein
MMWRHVGSGSLLPWATTRRGGGRSAVVLFVLVVMIATACTPTSSDDSPAALARCRGLAAETIDGMQRFVDGFAEVGLEDLTGDEIPGLAGLETNVAAARDRAVSTDCDLGRFDAMLTEEMARLAGRGPVGRRLAAALRGDRPASEKPAEDVTVDPSDDLAGVIAEAGSGSVITIEAGRYDLSEMIVIDRPLTLIGAGSDRTIVRSSSAGAAVLVRRDGALDIREMAIEHVGEAPASVVVVSSGALSMLGARVAGGIQDPESGRDGHGLALVFTQLSSQKVPEGVADVDVTGSEFVGNDQTGITVVGEVSPSITGSDALGNGLCGICFFDTSGGIVENNAIEDNEVGIGVSGEASPTLTGNIVRDNTVSGVLIDEQSSPEVLDNLIEGNGRVGISVSGDSILIEQNEIRDHPQGIALAGEATGIIRDNVFDGNDVAVLVAGEATPTVEANEMKNSGTGAIIYAESATGIVRGNDLADHAIGIQAGDDSAPMIEENDIDSVDGIGMLFLDRSMAVAVDNVVTGHATGIQVRGFAAPRIEGGSVWGASTTGVVFAERARGSVGGVGIRGTEIGILVGGNASPDVFKNMIEGTATAGIVFGGQATGVASENRVVDSGSVGIQVGMTATPDLDTNSLENSRDVGLLYIDQAAGTAVGNGISGGQFGIQVSDEATPTIEGNTLTELETDGIVFFADAGGEASGNSCARGSAIVLLSGADPTLGDNDCRVRRQS